MHERIEQHRYSFHGLAVELRCAVGGLRPYLRHLLGSCEVDRWPDGVVPVVGEIRSYDAKLIGQYLSSRAARIGGRAGQEVYHDGERFWLVDERFGVVEINFLKRRFRAWALPGAAERDPVEATDALLLWPLAQLLKGKGLELLPAPSVVRNGRGVLILAPYDLSRELHELAGAGLRVVGQRWTAVRADPELRDIELLHVPGCVERVSPAGLRGGGGSRWVDLSRQRLGVEQRHATCGAIVVIEPGRGASVGIHSAGPDAAEAIRAAWPIHDLHPTGRRSALPARLARACATFRVKLSRNPRDLLNALPALCAVPEMAAPRIHVRTNLAPAAPVAELRRAG